MKRVFLLVSVFLLGISMNAQVGIGTTDPDQTAQLEVYSKTGGVLLPRLQLAERDNISNPAEGLMIYNLNERCLNIFKEGNWKSFCGDSEAAQIAELDCVATQEDFNWATQEIDYGVNPPQPNGIPTVTAQVPLTTDNTVRLTIDVISEGSITVTAVTTNGYSFSYFNPLIGVGSQTIELIPSGTPKDFGTDVVTITVNGVVQTCQPTIIVEENVAPKTFTVDCNTLRVNGRYIKDVPSTGSHYVSVRVTNTSTTDPVSYHIYTEQVVNGISFDGSGTLEPGQSRNVSVLASGTPLAEGSFSYSLKSNSTVEVTDCSFTLNFEKIIRKIKILGLGGANYQPAASGNGYATKAILENSANFGRDVNSKILVDGFDFRNGSVTYGAALQSLITEFSPDIIVIAYPYSIASEATRNALISFVDNGGVVIDAQGEASGTAANFADYLRRMLGSTATPTINTGSYTSHRITTNDNPVMNGPFMNLINTSGSYYAGSDGTDGRYIGGLDSDPNVSVIAYNGDSTSGNAFMVMSKTRGYLWGGDGGWMAGHTSVYRNDTVFYPAFMNPLGIPAPKQYGNGRTVYNSFIYANAIAWAIEYVIEQNP